MKVFRKCWCDEKCIYKADCCLDYEYHCTNRSQMPSDIYDLHDFLQSRKSLMYSTCITVFGFTYVDKLYTGLTRLYVISKCPYDDQASSLCKRDRQQLVYAGGLIFYNRHCAFVMEL